ncbi:hypothetical protein AS593_07445 [Caulobacter vibrioides]|nr:hypothetical protein AS593_07445 [Caulobacter vibrioides]
MMSAATAAGSVLARLLGYLEHDPANVRLLADAAWAAFDEGDLEQASSLLRRREAIEASPPELLNLSGLIALRAERFDDAAAIFAALLLRAPDAAGLKFNLAWCRAMLADYVGADDLLDEATIAEVPGAAALKVETLHHQGRIDGALALGERLTAAGATDERLMGLLAAAALDDERLDLARAYAARAGEGSDGQSVLGMLALEGEDVGAARAAFDRALAAADGQTNPRALIGKGLTLLLDGQGGEASAYLDRGAAGYGDHLGSWVAAGWAHFTNGDYDGARARFEKVVALDGAFSEGHGGLAVVDVMRGDLDGAARHAEVAARLDRDSFSAALARVLLLQAAGDEALARRIVETALRTPLSPGGKTLAQAMAGLGR